MFSDFLNLTTNGRGTPLIWGHGLTSSMASEDATGLFDWQALTKLVQVVRYDARGHGRSPATYKPSDYIWSNLGQDMLGVANRLGAKQFVAGGASMGCATAIFAALAAPERVQAMVLAVPPTAWETRAAQTAVYETAAQLVETQGLDALMQAWAIQPSTPIFATDYPDLKTISLRHAANNNEKALPYILRGAAQSDLPSAEKLQTLNMPTLILAWETDPGHPVSTAKQLDALLPQSSLHIAANLEQIRRWPQLVYNFLEEIL